MSDFIQFRGVLPPESATGRRAALPPSKTAPGSVILHALSPLRGELDAALAHDDGPTALRLAYDALTRVVDALAACHGARLLPGQIRIHALLVELKALPLAPLPDGTLAESGAAIAVNYRNWAVDRPMAEAWAQILTERFQALWPGAWVVVPEL